MNANGSYGKPVTFLLTPEELDLLNRAIARYGESVNGTPSRSVVLRRMALRWAQIILGEIHEDLSLVQEADRAVG